MKKAAALVFILVVSWGMAQGQTESGQGQTESALAPLHTRDLLWHKATLDIAKIQAEFPGAMGVAIRDLSDGRELLINADDVFPTASSIKLALLAELYRQSQTGQGARLSDLYTVKKEDAAVPDSFIMNNLTPGVTRVTNRDLAAFVVAVSDNAATNVLIDRVGMDNVNRMLDSLGLKQTRLRRKMMDFSAAEQGRENVATPRQMAALMESIYRGKLLNKEMTDDFFNLLSTGKDSSIPRLLPEDIRIANKPGELTGVRTDTGIVFLKNHPFVISVMTSYARDDRGAADAISRIALVAFRYFDTVDAASGYGRVMTPLHGR